MIAPFLRRVYGTNGADATMTHLVFDLSRKYGSKAIEHKSYHKVNKADLKSSTVRPRVAKLAAQELTARVTFAKKYYHGKYDARHMRFMRLLYKPVKKNRDALLSMSLDAFIEVSRL